MRKSWALSLGVALAVLIAPTGAVAQESGRDNDAVCSFAFTLHFSPGVTLTPASGAQTSEGGKVSCTGSLQGHRVTGEGTFDSVDGRLDNANCLIDHSLGKYRFTVPTDGGPRTFEGTYDVRRIGLTFDVTVEQPGATGAGSGFVLPTKGDCVVTPLTEAFVYLTIKFTDAAAPRTTCDLNLGIVLVNCRSSSQG
jgi:hypothetical protein